MPALCAVLVCAFAYPGLHERTYMPCRECTPGSKVALIISPAAIGQRLVTSVASVSTRPEKWRVIFCGRRCQIYGPCDTLL